MASTEIGNTETIYLLQLFKRDLSDKLVAAAEEEILPAIRKSIRKAAEQCVVDMTPEVVSIYKGYENKLIVNLVIKDPNET